MEIWLSNGSKDKVRIPLNPESIGYKDTRNFEDIVLANGNERTVKSGRNLREYTISSIFPKRNSYYLGVKKLQTPMWHVKKIKKWMDDKRVLRLLVTTTNINEEVTIRSFDWNEEGGAVGDISYTLELKEYEPITYSKIKKVTKKKKPTTKPRKPSPKPKPKSYIVKKGDHLWKISKKYYGAGSQWRRIYNANKKVIGKNPNKIYPGQRLVIP